MLLTSQIALDDDCEGISDIKISPQIIAKILKKIKINSAAGPDNLPPIFFHHTAPSLSLPLSILFRSLIDLRSLPQEWKLSIIIPKFKKGDPSNPSNYRPIALTCTCCKVLETIISSELIQFLTDHKLITRHQHGFLKRHSTSTNLLESLNDWTISLSNHKSVTIAYIDFKSAFDSISHEKLLLKLAAYGIKDTLYFWIQAFLTNRLQKVKLGSSFSKTCFVTSGVPQGSVLGPLLFNLFVNDITDSLEPNTTAKLFADDLKLYREFSNVHPNNLQAQLNTIQNWSKLWQLQISLLKCSTLTLGSKELQTKLHLDGNYIAQSHNVRDLGITIDSDLKFKNHIHSIVTTASQRSALILRCFLSRNPDSLVRAFKVYVRPLLEFASTSFLVSLLLCTNTSN